MIMVDSPASVTVPAPAASVEVLISVRISVTLQQLDSICHHLTTYLISPHTFLNLLKLDSEDLYLVYIL